MDYISVIQSGILSGVAYDFLKYGIPLAFDSFKGGLKKQQQEWLLDEPTTQKILTRMSELYQSQPSVEQYDQVIQNDIVLAELVKAISEPQNQNTQTLNKSNQNTVIGGDNNGSITNHFYTPENTPLSSIKKE